MNPMARQICKRIKITGKIIAQTPLHVGGLGTDPTVDLSLAVDGQNRVYIPGTSLAGAFRSWMEACEMDMNQIWGFQEEDRGHASFIVIEDALVMLPTGAIAELRDHVGINRVSGTASDQTKFDRAIVPKGSWFQLEMTLDIAVKDPIDLDGVEELIDALTRDGLRLGAAKTRGLGLVKMTGLQWLDYDLSSFQGMVATLKQVGTPYQPKAVSTARLWHLSIHWKPTGALMVKSGQDGVAVDILPLVSRDREQVAFVLPGSAVKGAMRSQTERILRTVLRSSQIQPTDKLQDQMENAALSLAHWLFGKAGTGKSTEQVSFGRGALMVDDCFCAQKLDPVMWQAVEQAVDAPQNGGTLRQKLDASGLTETQQAVHVAIDRWTGGAAEQMLYSALEPFKLDWEPIELSLDLRRIEGSAQGAVQALLFLMLRDLALGRIPLGYGANRGYGSVAVEKIVVRGPGGNEQELTFSQAGVMSGMDFTDLDQAWRNWLIQAQSQQFQEVTQ
jgi:CRISPR/Cas system CSM-associated protein Csm3 (group 7 of RAMP superfamily)